MKMNENRTVFPTERTVFPTERVIGRGNHYPPG